jgi:hypothetical protein
VVAVLATAPDPPPPPLPDIVLQRPALELRLLPQTASMKGRSLVEYLEVSGGKAYVAFSPDDINLMLSMIGETLEAVDDVELQTRTGFDRGQIAAFQKSLQEIDSTISGHSF